MILTALLLPFTVFANTDQTQSSFNTEIAFCTSNQVMAQSFRPTLGILNRVNVKLDYIGTQNPNPQTITLSVIEGNDPTTSTEMPNQNGQKFWTFNVLTGNRFNAYFDVGQINVDTSKKYWIKLQYSNTANCPPSGTNNLYWYESTSNPYANGNAYTVSNGINSGADFAFSTEGTATPHCDVARYCSDNSTSAYRDNLCNVTLTSCGSGNICEQSTGLCVTNTNVYVTSTDIRTTDGFTSTNFTAGSAMALYSNLINQGTTGTYNAVYEILQNGIQQTVLEQTSNASIGSSGSSGGNIQWSKAFAIPNNWLGDYLFRVTADPCSSSDSANCSRSLGFTITLACIDADHDGYYANCGAVHDCDDLNPNFTTRCCIDQCSSNQTSCSTDNTSQRTCQMGAGGCLEWSNYTACSIYQICKQTSCQDNRPDLLITSMRIQKVSP